jgi:FlaA1/EpsC-like NDP-sugar epimerase
MVEDGKYVGQKNGSGIFPKMLSVQLAEHKLILLIVDGLLVNVALLIGLWFGAGRSDWVFSPALVLEYSPWFIGVTILYFIFSTANDAYRPRTASDPTASSVAIIKTIVQILVLYLLVYALLPPYSLPRHLIGAFTVVAPLLLVVWRRVYSIMFVPVFRRRAIVVGAGWGGTTITKTVKEYASAHFEIVGFVDDDPTRQQARVEGLPVLGVPAQLPSLTQQHHVTDVVLAINRDVPGHILTSLMHCFERGIRISTMPELYEKLTDRVPVEHVGDNWFVVLPLSGNGSNLAYRLIKRMVDILTALVGLLFFWAAASVSGVVHQAGFAWTGLLPPGACGAGWRCFQHF